MYSAVQGYFVPDLSLKVAATSNYGLDILDRLKTLVESFGDYRRVEIKEGDEEMMRVAQQQIPFCLIERLPENENKVASHTGIEHTLNVNIHIIVKSTKEQERYEAADEMANDMRNSIEADTVLLTYLPRFEGTQPDPEVKHPYEHLVLPVGFTYWTTATGR